MQEVSISADLYSDSEDSGCESEEQTDDEDDDADADDETMEHDVIERHGADTDDALEHSSNGTGSESGNNGDDDLCHDKARFCTLIIGDSINCVNSNTQNEAFSL